MTAARAVRHLPVLGLLAVVASCGEDTGASSTTGNPNATQGSTPQGGDKTQGSKDAARDQLLAAIAEREPAAVIDALLDRCHGTLRGATEMANCSIKLRRTPDEANPWHVLIGSENSMRITLRDKRRKIETRGHAWLVPSATEGGSPTELKGEERTEFQRLQKLIRSLVLAPLYGPHKVTRQGPTVFAIIHPGGETWRLELDVFTPKDQPAVLLPAKLSGPGGTVTMHSYLHTGVTHWPKKVTLDSFGEHWFQMQLSGLVFNPSVFTTPGMKISQGKAKVRRDFAPASPPNQPVLTDVPARSCLVVPDPGTWKARFAKLLENGKTLSEQGQQPADLDFFYVENNTRYLAMPFEMAEVRSGGKPFVVRKGQKIVHFPAQQIVQVYPDNGSMEACEAKARKLIDAFVAAEGLQAQGPLRAMPWIQVDRELPPARMLQHLRIGFELPVGKR